MALGNGFSAINNLKLDDSLGIQFTGRSSDPTDSDLAAGRIYYNSVSSALVWYNGSSWQTIGSGSGSTPSWETLYLNDATFNLTSATWTITQSAAADLLTLTKTNVGAGSVLAINNSGSGADILGTASTWSVSAIGAAVFTAIAMLDNELITFGTGSDATIGWNGSVLNIAGAVDFDDNITLAANATIVQTGVAGSAVYTITAGDVVWSDSSLLLTDADNAETVTIINNTATTIGAAASAAIVQIESTSLTTGAALNVQLTEGTLNGGFYYSAWDATAGARVWSVGEDGITTITGVGGSNVLVLTAGDAVLSDGSLTITDADNAASLSITNNTATSASVFVFAGSGTFTGSTTTSFATLTASGLTSGTVLYMPAAALTTGKVLNVVAAAQTDGVLATLTGGGANITATGRLLKLDMGAGTAGQALEIVTSGAYNGAGLLTVTMNSATAVTGVGVLVSSTGTGMTSGSLLRVSSGTTAAVATNGIVSFIATADFTVAASSGFHMITADSTTAGVISRISGTALTTGVALSLVSTGTGMTSGSLLRVVSGSTGAIATNGIVSIQATGAFTSTSNAGLFNVGASAVTGTATLVNFISSAAAQTDVTVLNVENAGFTTGYTGSMLRIKSPSTTGACKIVDLIADGITSGGIAMKISVAALTTGDGLVIDNGTAATTTGSLLKVTAGGTGAVSSDGLVSFQHSGVYTSTTVGFVNVVASATTGGTIASITGAALTDGTALLISNASITTGKHLAILGAAGASMFSVSANGATVIAGNAAGTASLTQTAGDHVLTSGHMKLTAGFIAATPDTRTGAGAISVTHLSTKLVTTGADALTLADGVEGQLKFITMITDGGDGTLTPTNLQGGTTITFSAVGQSCILLFTDAEWCVMSLNGAALA